MPIEIETFYEEKVTAKVIYSIFGFSFSNLVLNGPSKKV